jgi:peptidoglycan hydrolase-like protein with peptidoglycan-binding domain
MEAPTPDRAAPTRWRAPVLLIAAAISLLVLSAGVAVASSSGGTRSSRSTTLSLGSTGRAVKQLQRKLHVRPVSGYFGTQTRSAVRRFQRTHGLKADGVAGPATLRRLGLRATSSGYATGGASPSSPRRPSSRRNRSSRVKLPAVLRKIAQCESGGNPRAVSRTGRYRGKFQFDQSTWEAWGGRGDPAAAPESTQDRVALRLYRNRGTAPWPNCA